MYIAKWLSLVSQAAVVLVLACLVCLSPLGTMIMVLGLVTPVPNDSGEPVDAIVILGRGLGTIPFRADIAVELWKRNRAPFIFASGLPEAEAIVQYLKEQGVPSKALQGETCSLTTEENALFTIMALKLQGAQRILLVTDPSHMLRSLLTFRSLGVEVIPHMTSLPADLTSRQTNHSFRRETSALLGYALMGRFLPRSFDDPRYLAPERLKQAQMGRCALGVDAFSTSQ